MHDSKNFAEGTEGYRYTEEKITLEDENLELTSGEMTTVLIIKLSSGTF